MTENDDPPLRETNGKDNALYRARGGNRPVDYCLLSHDFRSASVPGFGPWGNYHVGYFRNIQQNYSEVE